MKILNLLIASVDGACRRQVEIVARAATENGHDVMTWPDPDVSVVGWPRSLRAATAAAVHQWFDSLWRIRQFDPDIVHCWYWRARPVAALAAVLGRGRRIVATAASADAIPRLPRRIEQWGTVDWVTPAPPPGSFSQRVQVIEPGAPSAPSFQADAWEPGIDGSAPIIWCPGPAMTRDAVFRSIWTFDIVKYVDRHTQLVITGADSKRKVGQWVRHFPIVRDRVHIAEIEDGVIAADVVWLAGRHRASVPLLAELQAAGSVVVASPCNGLGRILQHGETCLLAPEADIPALAQTTLRLLADEPLRRRLSAEARRRALKRFSTERMVRQYLELYQGNNVEQMSIAS